MRTRLTPVRLRLLLLSLWGLVPTAYSMLENHSVSEVIHTERQGGGWLTVPFDVSQELGLARRSDSKEIILFLQLRYACSEQPLRISLFHGRRVNL